MSKEEGKSNLAGLLDMLKQRKDKARPSESKVSDGLIVSKMSKTTIK